MRARSFSGYVLLSLLAACSPSETADFGPDLSMKPSGSSGRTNVDGGSNGNVGGVVGVAGSGGKATQGGASTGGATVAGMATGGGGSSAAAGDGNPPEPPAAAGAVDGGAGGEPNVPPAPVCGNGVIEAGEECDGGALKEKDGCSDDCQVVCAELDKDLVESDDHHCYGGYNDEADFAGAREACAAKGAHLVTISGAAENEIVASFVRESKFLGAFEDVPAMTEGKGDYAWITGEPLSYTNWQEGQPNRAESRCQSGGGPGPIVGAKLCYEHCVAMVTEGKWDDKLCDRADGYVCEWEPLGTK